MRGGKGWRWLFVLIAGVGLAVNQAKSQCSRYEALFGGNPSPRTAINGVVTIDDDNDPATRGRLYLVGSMIRWDDGRFQAIGEWDGTKFRIANPGLDATSVIAGATSWDPDGSGPQLPRLVVCGSLRPEGQSAARNMVMSWDGGQWRELPLDGLASHAAFNGVIEWDRDGAGPLPPSLIVYGDLTVSSGSRNAAVWNGQSWVSVGSATFATRPFTAACVFDPDGSGSQTPRLYLGADLAVVEFEATSSRQLGSLSGVTALAWCDLDGAGPTPRALFAATQTGGPYRWNGAAWVSFGASLSVTRRINTLCEFDSDGPGPKPPMLVIGGEFQSPANSGEYGLVGFDGVGWIRMGYSANASVRMLAIHDFDGAGSLPGALLCLSNSPTQPVVRIVGEQADSLPGFQPRGLVVNEVQEPMNALASITNNDASKPDAIAAGLSSGVSVFQGGKWSSIPGEFNAPVKALISWDPDGDGSAKPHLVTGGTQFRIDSRTVFSPARWDGSAWSQMGAGLTFSGTSSVAAFTTWDFDGPGPEAAQLVAGGGFTSTGSTRVYGVARWTGAAWAPIGTGVNSGVFAFGRLDPDGDGPDGEQLIALGRFYGLGGSLTDRSIHCVARWDGSTWRPLDVGAPSAFLRNDSLELLPEVYAATLWDPDGNGPQPKRLVIGGWFNAINNDFSMAGLAMWSGERWQSLGFPRQVVVKSLATIDPDGDGPRAPLLVIGGSITGFSERPIAYFDGTTWTIPDTRIPIIYPAFGSVVRCMAPWDPDGAGPQTQVVLAGGPFDLVGSESHSMLTALRFKLVEVSVAPASESVRVREAITLTAALADGSLGSAYRWHLNGALIEDGTRPSGASASGSTTSILKISDVRVADAGVYSCEIESECGKETGEGAQVEVVCPCDMNHDGTICFEDFDAFVGAFEAGEAPADFNRDGFLTFEDFDEFVSVFEAGC